VHIKDFGEFGGVGFQAVLEFGVAD